MQNLTTRKIFFGLFGIIAAAVLCTLPFFASKQEVIYFYTKKPTLDSMEQNFADALQEAGYKVIVNNKSFPQKNTIGVWFKAPEFAANLTKSEAKYNFIYSDLHYPFEWDGLKKLPVVLTPHRDLFEHYARANVKTALLELNPKSDNNTVKTAALRLAELIKWLQNNDIR